MTSNQATIIKNAIEHYLEIGLTDKSDIYSKVVLDLGVPRPTVRRVARDLRMQYINKVKILESGSDDSSSIAL